ncbi:unnamed protein product [Linum trigynum]|uniref:Uncharacterized protein n=1 Tax=Linum trigynum TaxID=586398 RepID=A0AAV2FR99_9ROSI
MGCYNCSLDVCDRSLRLLGVSTSTPTAVPIAASKGQIFTLRVCSATTFAPEASMEIEISSKEAGFPKGGTSTATDENGVALLSTTTGGESVGG